MPPLAIGCQLYTLRDLTLNNFAHTVGEVARMGYRSVELAGYGNLRTADEVRNVLRDIGLTVAASHTNIDALERNLGRVLDDSEALQCPTVVLSFLPEARRKDAAGWRASAELLNRIGERCQSRGIDLAYHHHHFEFQKFDGQYALDLLWNNTDPRFLKAELDTFWIRYGGENPAGYIARLGPRCTHLHLKDLHPGPPPRFAEIGLGRLDFPAILKAANAAGVRWGIVEQDSTYERAPLESVRISLENLKALTGPDVG
jgi:sugar phosphate isomerase/epimerase